MSPTGRSLARAAAVSVTACEPWFLERMVGRSGPQLDDHLEDLLARGVLRDTAEGTVSGFRPHPRRGAAGDPRRRWCTACATAPPRCSPRPDSRPVPPVNCWTRPARGAGSTPDLVSGLADSPSVDPSIAADLLLALHARQDIAVEPDRRRTWMLATIDHLMLAGRSQQALRLLTEEIAADRDTAPYRALLLGRLGAWHATERPSRRSHICTAPSPTKASDRPSTPGC